MVVLPVVAPIAKVEATPPIFKVVAPVLKRFPVVAVVVIDPPLIARLPAVVISPLAPVIEKLVAVTSLAPRERAFTIAASERSRPIVIAPPPDEVIASPVGSVFDTA